MQTSEATSSILVEMNRTAGDPVLYAKGFLEGIEPTSLPNIIDFSDYADESSFRSRTNFHFKLMAKMPTRKERYYVAVYNSNAYIQESAEYHLKAIWDSESIQGSEILCPNECWGRGKCVVSDRNAQFECMCDRGKGRRVIVTTKVFMFDP